LTQQICKKLRWTKPRRCFLAPRLDIRRALSQGQEKYESPTVTTNVVTTTHFPTTILQDRVADQRNQLQPADLLQWQIQSASAL